MMNRLTFIAVFLFSFNAFAASAKSAQASLNSDSCETHYQDSKNSLACAGLDREECILATVARWAPNSACARDLRERGELAGTPVGCRHLVSGGFSSSIINACITQRAEANTSGTRAVN